MAGVSIDARDDRVVLTALMEAFPLDDQVGDGAAALLCRQPEVQTVACEMPLALSVCCCALTWVKR